MAKKSRKRDENHELVSEIYDNLNKNVILNYEIRSPFEFNEKHSQFLHLLQTNSLLPELTICNSVP